MYVQNDRLDNQLHCRRQAGFSLTEILVTVGLLAILSGIATVSYNSYINTARTQAVRRTLNAMESAFLSCMSFNKNQVEKCNDLTKIRFSLPGATVPITPLNPDKEYKSNQLHVRVDVQGTRLCFLSRIWLWGSQPNNVWVTKQMNEKEGVRGCTEYDNGRLIRRCFEKTGIRAGCKLSTAQCCHKCSNTIFCEFGKGAKS